MDEGNDLLMSSGGGTPWAKWENDNDVVAGIVQGKPVVKQARDYDTGQPKVYPSGDPVINIVIMVQTGKKDPDIENDTGVRQVVMRKDSNMHTAIRNAVRAADAKGIEDGGKLTVVRTGEESKQNSKGMKYKQRTFAAKYEPPAAGDDEQKALGALADILAQPPF